MNFLHASFARTRPGVLPLLVLALFFGTLARAADPLPAKPARFFNDYAGVISTETAETLNSRIAAYERETSNQVLVAIFKQLPGNAALEDFTQRTAEAWGVGQKKNDNGLVLFVFTEPRKLRIEVGYGLEGAVPDLLARQIIDNEIRPALRSGDFDAGLTRGVEAILQAARGEYKGTGRTNADARNHQPRGLWILIIFLMILALQFYLARASRRRGRVYGPQGSRGLGGGGIWPVGGSGGWSGGGGGGGFSGGGGSFGGGGASGDW